jgi:hypothetical protein
MIIRDFTNKKKEELIEQIKEVGEDRPWEQPSPLSFSVPDEIYQPFREATVFYNSLVDKNIHTLKDIEKIWTDVQRLDDVYGNRLKNIQELTENLNAKIALIDRAIGTNLTSTLSQDPSTFLAGIDEINEKIINNKINIEYSKLVSYDERGNLVYDYDAIVLALIHSKSDYHMAAMKKIIQSMADENGNLNQNKYHDFMTTLYLKIISSREYFKTINSLIPIAGFTYILKTNNGTQTSLIFNACLGSPMYIMRFLLYLAAKSMTKK